MVDELFLISINAMGSIKLSNSRQILLKQIVWTVLLLFIAYYLYRAFYYRFLKEGLGPTLWDKQFWYVFHIITAVPIILIGPLQFWAGFRKRHLQLHRQLGKIYVLGSLLGGVTALYLAITIQYPESIIPLSISSLLWLFMTVAAWITIKKRLIQAHRLFMIRSYVLALSFVFVRILSDLVEHHGFLSFIPIPEAQAATYEWSSWVVPLLITELLIGWLPAMKAVKKAKPATAGKIAKEGAY